MSTEFTKKMKETSFFSVDYGIICAKKGNIEFLQFIHNYVMIVNKKGAYHTSQIRPITDLRNTMEISQLCLARNSWFMQPLSMDKEKICLQFKNCI